jgi:hypothetical protein
MKTTDIICRLKLAAQCAILGVVSPKLRQISIDFHKKTIFFNCYFEGAIDDNRENMQIAGTEIIPDFTEKGFQFIEENILRYDYPQPLNGLPGIPIYRRKE